MWPLSPREGMLDTPRTTLVAAIVQGTSATWVHCGDSRLYVVRQGELLTRTRDHSYLEQQSGAGVVRHPVPSPTWPLVFSPQQKTPSVVRAQVCAPPAST